MFLNDPMLYGVTLPYRDLPLQPPVQSFLPWQNIPQNIPQSFLPWQNVPRFIPPFYGMQTPYLSYVNPYMHTAAFNPFYQVPQIPQMHQVPQIPQFNLPQSNIPQMNWNRPFCY